MISRMRERLAAQDVRGNCSVAVVQINSIKVAWIVDLALRWLGIMTVAIDGPAEIDALTGLDVMLVVTDGGDGAGRVPAASFRAAPRIMVEAASSARRTTTRVPLDHRAVAAGRDIVFSSGTRVCARRS